LKKLTSVIQPDGGLSLTRYVSEIKDLSWGEMHSLKLQKLNQISPKNTMAIMFTLLNDAIEALNFKNPIKNKFLLDFIEEVQMDYQFESINDWVVYCYELGRGELFDSKIYRLGLPELKDSWKAYLDISYAKREEEYRKQKEDLKKSYAVDSNNKASEEFVSNLLQQYRAENVRKSIQEDKRRAAENGPSNLTEQAYIEGILEKIVSLPPIDQAKLVFTWSSDRFLRPYISRLVDLLSTEQIELLFEVFQQHVNNLPYQVPEAQILEVKSRLNL